MAKKIIRKFNPDIAIGVGGYASGPLLWAAAKSGIPTLIQEQNSYPGITNKLLAKHANKICVAYDKMERFFPADKIVKTGNPIRSKIVEANIEQKEAVESYGFNPLHKTILVVGGSLGARTINQGVAKSLNKLNQSNVQLIWQTGKHYYPKAKEAGQGYKNVRVFEFIYDMETAFAAADIIISRAGASTISELCVVGKPVVFVPSPNVSEDHQTKNAMALVDEDAALMVTDADVEDRLIKTVFSQLKNKEKAKTISENIKKLALTNSAEVIVNEVFAIADRKQA